MNQAHVLQPQPQPLGALGSQRPSALAGMRHLAHAYLLEITVFAAMALRFAPEPFNISSFILLAIVAFTSRTGTVFALAASWFVYSVNPGLADEEVPLGAGARYLVVAAAALAAILRSARLNAGERASLPTITTAAVALALLAHSALFSLYPGLSIFKAVFWGVVSLTLVTTMRGMSDEELVKLHRFLLAFFGVILVLSLLILPLPEAKLRNGVGLQGLLNQPQMFGVFCAVAGAYFFGTAIASPKPSWITLGMVVLSLQGVLESAARTGGFAMVLGCLGLIGLAVVRSALFFRKTVPGLFSGRFGVLAFVALLAGILSSSIAQQATEEFLRKDARGTQAIASYNAERQFIIQDMLDNIGRHPAEGIGLGIQSATHLMDVEVDPVTGLPISAPVEKGVMWIALFEELGLFLGIAIFGWILWGAARSIEVSAAAAGASLAYFISNFGEATFFSPGATGMLGLIIFYLGLARGRRAPEPEAAPPQFAWPAAAAAPAPAPIHPHN